jgi:hypothetical protein
VTKLGVVTVVTVVDDVMSGAGRWEGEPPESIRRSFDTTEKVVVVPSDVSACGGECDGAPVVGEF